MGISSKGQNVLRGVIRQTHSQGGDAISTNNLLNTYHMGTVDKAEM